MKSASKATPLRLETPQTWIRLRKNTVIANWLPTGLRWASAMVLWATQKSGEHYRRGLSGLRAFMHALRHLNIGAGRIVWQDIVRIDVSIKKRQFHKSPKIVDSLKSAKDGNGRLHLIGLVRRCDSYSRSRLLNCGQYRSRMVACTPTSRTCTLC